MTLRFYHNSDCLCKVKKGDAATALVAASPFRLNFNEKCRVPQRRLADALRTRPPWSAEGLIPAGLSNSKDKPLFRPPQQETGREVLWRCL
jgi:hypothetical protein